MTRLDQMTATEFTGWVVATAAANGWLVSPATDTTAGAPTLWLVKDAQMLAVLVKAERGKVTDAQLDWLDALQPVESVTEIIWRPSNMAEAFARLTAKPATNGAAA